jgi:hypothetical protein
MLFANDQHESFRGNPHTRPTVTLSVDVEALPSRTTVADKVGRLIWGNFNDSQMGVPRIIDILDEAQVKATFFLEYLGALRYGKSPVFQVGTYIKNRGQSLEVHAHPEMIPEGIVGNGAVSWDAMDLETQTAVMQLTRQLYSENVGMPARIFRAGSLRFNSLTPLAAHRAGYSALSNYFADPYLQPVDYAEIPGHFLWKNGVHEMTVSACLDEIIQCDTGWMARLDKLLTGPSAVRHFFIHSWSLIRRDAKGCHDSFDDEYSVRFRQILEYLKNHGDIVGMEMTAGFEKADWTIAPESIADSPDGRAKVSFEPSASGYLRKRLFATNKVKSAIEVRYHEKRVAGFPAYRSVVPSNGPVPFIGDNRCFTIEVRDLCGSTTIPYELSGMRAYLQVANQPFCTHATELFDALFRKHPEVKEIVFSDALGDHLLKSPHVIAAPVGTASVLSLPTTFDRYKSLAIDKNLKSLIEENERDLSRNHRNIRIGFCGSVFEEELTSAIFNELIDLVRHCMCDQAEMTGMSWTDPFTEEWITKNFPIYRDAGLCCYLEVEGEKVAAMLNLVQDIMLEHVADGHIDSTGVGRHIGEILLFRTIEKFICLGGRIIKFGRFSKTDLGAKESFGVAEQQLYSGTAYRRAPRLGSALPSDAAILNLLEKGSSIRDIHVYLGVSAKKWIERTPPAPYSFDFAVDRFGPAPAGWRGWHSPIIDTLHITFDWLCQIYRPTALFDWNCCAGRNLIALAEYGIERLGGLVFGSAAVKAVQSNFAAANMVSPDLHTVSLPEAIRGLDLCDYDLFLAYHPCPEAVFMDLVDRMKAASAASDHPVYLVYINCVYSQTLVDAGFKQVEAFEQHRNGWRFTDRAAIFNYSAAGSD